MKKHKFTFRQSIDCPPVQLGKDFSPSWWEGPSIIILYFGKPIIVLSAVFYIFFK